MTGVSDTPPVARSLVIYAWSLALLGVAALVASWFFQPPIINAAFVFLVFATVVADWLAIELPGQGSTSLAYPLSIAIAVMFGPAGASTAASLGAFNLRDLPDTTGAVHGAQFRTIGGLPAPLLAGCTCGSVVTFWLLVSVGLGSTDP